MSGSPGETLNRWTNIIVAIFFFLFNLIGITHVPAAFDKFLSAVGLVFAAVIVWYALQLTGRAVTPR